MPTPIRTVAEAYQLSGDCLHIPCYPRYGVDRGDRGDFPYVYRRSARYLQCQAARFALVGGGVTTALGDGAIDPLQDLPARWSGYFQERLGGHAGEVIRYRGELGFLDLVTQRPEYSVLSPHPFDSALVPVERNLGGASIAGTVQQLNDKGGMAALSEHAIPFRCYSAAEFASGAWRAEWSLPLVVKLVTPSGGGDGVVLCRSEVDISLAQQRLAGHAVKVEPLIEGIVRNLNVNLRVTRAGEIDIIGCSEQRIDSGQTYCGNTIDLDWHPARAIAQLCTDVARRAWAMGWYGVCGLDLIETHGGEIFLMDPNFRLNGSTPFFLLRERFKARFRQPYLETGYFHFDGAPSALLDACRNELEAGELWPVGLYCDPLDGQTRTYAALACEADPAMIPRIKDRLARKGLLAGVALS